MKTPGRRRFTLRERGSLRYVTVEVDERGTTYWEEESGDVRSFPFTPSPRLEGLVSAMDSAAKWLDGWNTTIDLDTITANETNLASFAAYARKHTDEETSARLDRLIAAYSSSCGVL